MRRASFVLWSWLYLVLAALLLGIGSPAGATEVTFDRGDELVREYPNFKSHLQTLWDTISQKWLKLDGSDAPSILFSEFSPEAQGPEWTKFQIDWTVSHPTIWRDWLCNTKNICDYQPTADEIKKYIEDGVYPFPKQLMAGLTYLDTNRIQINANIDFFPFLINDPYGQKVDYSGHGYYALGHEMMHMVLHRLKIPHELHHCIFVTEDTQQLSLMGRVANMVITEGMGGTFVYQAGLQPEVGTAPCSYLNEQQKQEAAKWAATLSTLINTAVVKN